MFGIASAGTGHGHVDPMVTLVKCVYRRLPLYYYPCFLVAQILGHWVGSTMAYLFLASDITLFENTATVEIIPEHEMTIVDIR